MWKTENERLSYINEVDYLKNRPITKDLERLLLSGAIAKAEDDEGYYNDDAILDAIEMAKRNFDIEPVILNKSLF